MAQQALPAGRRRRRGRALFGLLDASGWGWASVKAVFWFIRSSSCWATSRTGPTTSRSTGRSTSGILAWSPVNFCPPANESLPCPAPVGAVVPWEVAPPEISLPAPRTDGSVIQSGTHAAVHRRQRRREAGRHDVRRDDVRDRATSTSGGTGRSCPRLAPTAPRRSPAAASSSPAASGPTASRPRRCTSSRTTGQNGQLGKWQTAKEAGLDLDLPQPIAGAVLLPVSDGLLLIGGTSDGKTPVKTVWKSAFDKSGKLQKWVKQPDLYLAVSDASAAVAGDFVWVYGGTSTDGPTKTVQRGEYGTGGAGDDSSSDGASPAAAPTCPSRGRTPAASRRAARSTSSAATTARRRRPRCTGPCPTTTATSPSGSTSPRATCRSRAAASRARPRSSSGPDAILIGGTTTERGRRRRGAGEPRAPGAVLPAGAGRRDGAGAEDRRRDRPAARLPGGEHRRDHELRDPAARRLGVRPQGEGRRGSRVAQEPTAAPRAAAR